MEHWQILIVAGVLLVILEILTPALFFLNLALASFATSLLAFFIQDWNILIPVFVVFSGAFLLFLRPLLIRKRSNGSKETGVEAKYIGKTAKVTETVSATGGIVSIYDERWNARSENGEEIAVGSEVKIVRNESLMLYVQKL